MYISVVVIFDLWSPTQRKIVFHIFSLFVFKCLSYAELTLTGILAVVDAVRSGTCVGLPTGLCVCLS